MSGQIELVALGDPLVDSYAEIRWHKLNQLIGLGGRSVCVFWPGSLQVKAESYFITHPSMLNLAVQTHID